MTKHMKTYSFTAVITGLDIEDDDALDRLYEAGCDDASFGSCEGVVTADFDREAASLDDAVESAKRDLKAGGVTALWFTENDA